MGDKDWGSPEITVAFVALAVSLVALLGTVMQVVQQYIASATGYSQCNEKVMGGWAKTKGRRFNWHEMRFEVNFDSPVIFVCKPDNPYGPIPKETIYFLNGTKESLDNTWTSSDIDLREEYLKLSTKERIHTADNEKASWLILLYAVQRMELKSSEWQTKQYESQPPNQLSSKYSLPAQPPSLEDNHTLTVALQRKRKSWDTMPKDTTKPYATTTMCHLIEMLAALGIYWKEFDRRKDRYQAEGNGFLVLGDRVSNLGLMFSIQVSGKCHFQDNRVIPVDFVKELCFGYVPTIYRKVTEDQRVEVPSDLPEDLSTLQLATRRDMAESLRVIGCNNNTVKYFLSDESRTSHLFPVTFELLGMLGHNCHIENSSFTFLPNPTCDRWDKRAVSLIKVMASFRNLYQHEILYLRRRNPVIVKRITQHAEDIVQHATEKDGIDRLIFLQVLHRAIDDADEILTARPKAGFPTTPQGTANGGAGGDAGGGAGGGGVAEVMSPHICSPEEDHLASIQDSRREIVQDVLRSHFQEVLRLLNERDDRPSDTQSLHVPDGNRMPRSPRHSRFESRPAQRGFDQMDNASPDERQQYFMEVYFDMIRERAVPIAAQSTGRRASLAGSRPASMHSLHLSDAGGDVAVYSRPVSRDVSPHVNENETIALLSSDSEDEEGTKIAEIALNGVDKTTKTAEKKQQTTPIKKPEPKPIPLSSEEVSHDDVWCTLVFRMICWLMLHDFNKLDIQVSKSELLGSRMPVYVS